MANTSAYQKLQSLWQDDRKYMQRLILSSISSLLLCFTVLFFGPLEINAGQQQWLVFLLGQMILPIIIVFFFAFITLTFSVALLKGKIYNTAVTVIFALGLCCYLQGMFFNGHLGALTGDSIVWQGLKPPLIINTFLWVAVFSIPFIIRFFSHIIWEKAIKLVSILIVLMQCVGAVSIFVMAPPIMENKPYFTKENMHAYSSKSNMLVFVLDRMDYEYITEVINEEPDFFNRLDGFTMYHNAISEFARTIPAVNYMLTSNSEDAYMVPTAEYFEKSWGGNNVLRRLHDKKYEINLYTDYSNLFSPTTTGANIVSNVSTAGSSINIIGAMERLVYLSAYRYMPLALKPFFWDYTGDINKASLKEGSERYDIDEVAFSKGIGGITTSQQSFFKLYHFLGSHPPYTVNRDGARLGNETSAAQQTMGNINIIINTLNKLKELGLYENTSIIITADHGSAVSDLLPLQKATTIGMFYKPVGAIDTPLQHSNAPVSLKNIPATIAKNCGVAYSDLGVPLDEVANDPHFKRYFYKSLESATSKDEETIITYEVLADATKLVNWTQVSQKPIPFHFYYS